MPQEQFSLPVRYGLRARWVFPVMAAPLHDGVVTVRDGTIESVGTQNTVQPSFDLGEVALLPGLVNAHTHLEFSDLAAPLGSPGMPLPDWLRVVIQHRRGRADSPASAVRRGVRESLAAGVTMLGEIATAGWEWPAATLEPKVVAFHESIGLGAERRAPLLAAAREFLDARPGTDTARLIAGFSPHAPYTVAFGLCEELVKLASERNSPVAMHLAESREELQLLRDGSGPLRELLDELGVWDDLAISRPASPLDYLRLLALAPRALVVHGNYLTNEEFDLLAEHSERMSLVHCPRTHAYFEHEPFPLARLLSAGVAVCVGTDSRASNPDLRLLEELRTVARRHMDVSPATILALGTHHGARALGMARETGAISTGMRADLCAVPIASRTASDPHELLWEGDADVCLTICAGKLVHGSAPFADCAT